MIDSFRCVFLVNRLSPKPWRLLFLTPFACLMLLVLFMLAEGLKNPQETIGLLIWDWLMGVFALLWHGEARVGIDVRDVVERGNHRAGWVISTKLLGFTLCFGLTFVLTPEDMD